MTSPATQISICDDRQGYRDYREGRTSRDKNVTINEPYFIVHFRTQPVMPNVLPIEAMGQAAGVFMLTSANLGNQIADFMSCDKIKFRQTVTLGDQLKTHAKLIKRKGGTIGVEETAHRVEDKAISSAQLMFIFVGIRK